jgi:hypothetical protein
MSQKSAIIRQYGTPNNRTHAYPFTRDIECVLGKMCHGVAQEISFLTEMFQRHNERVYRASVSRRGPGKRNAFNEGRMAPTAIRQYGNTAIRQYGNTAIRQYGNTAIRQYGNTAIIL